MKDLLERIYDWFGIYNADYPLIYDVLYTEGGYTLLGIAILVCPILVLGVFYFLWKYPYAKIYHWLLWLLVACLVTAIASWNISNGAIFNSENQGLIDALYEDAGYEDHAGALPAKFALVNSLLAAILGFIYSLILKHFSKTKIHLPF